MSKPKTKPFFHSKTIIGTAITALTFVIEIANLPITDGEVATGVNALFALLGLLFTIYGRITAETTLTIK